MSYTTGELLNSTSEPNNTVYANQIEFKKIFLKKYLKDTRYTHIHSNSSLSIKHSFHHEIYDKFINEEK